MITPEKVLSEFLTPAAIDLAKIVFSSSFIFNEPSHLFNVDEKYLFYI